ncbi:hypothetical protein DFA_02994 [Cavenderia fasciculata]|uniref:Thioredoxin domain-containing protein n=1 Tax=Cavenderia fasciculata TaxID=261658 RepID=F4PGB6_CACFS|nr:uncharacterized protein DFA_02994 [Cavenderia fasciculata]EGG24750.1 hypothetical protein DFA_02994 [Cavenderia fasciculata]|eukprot:XP_004362601.1 hypothetical protein DFA_02994 [Cavenderia fasciculata]
MSIPTPTGFGVLTTYAQVQTLLVNANPTQLIVFYLTGYPCPACAIIAPHVNKWVAKFPTVQFYHIDFNTDAGQNHEACQMPSIPIARCFKDYTNTEIMIAESGGTNYGYMETMINNNKPREVSILTQ